MKNGIKRLMCALFALVGSLNTPAQDWGVIEESSPMSASKSAEWWVNSGAYFYLWENSAGDNIGHTVLGTLPQNDFWRRLYGISNPKDTDNGYHPQNIARFITKKNWGDFSQEMYFLIVNSNLSKSENRNASNGILLFNRYSDGDNLYYTGLRVDGHPVIKKKIAGTYYTLAYPKALYPGTYDRTKNQNLIPIQKWIGIKSTVQNMPDNSVLIRLYVDLEADGSWELVAEAIDDGILWGQPLRKNAHAGVRGDFMDLVFYQYKIAPLEN